MNRKLIFVIVRNIMSQLGGKINKLFYAIKQNKYTLSIVSHMDFTVALILPYKICDL